MTDPRTLAAALVLSTSAAAAPVDHPTPYPVPHGLIFYPDPIRGRHSFGPEDGVDVLPGGKADWTAPPSARATVTLPRRAVAGYVSGYRERRVPALPVTPLCCRQGSPETADPPAAEHPAPVGLPGAVWLMLAGLGALAWVRRG